CNDAPFFDHPDLRGRVPGPVRRAPSPQPAPGAFRHEALPHRGQPAHVGPVPGLRAASLRAALLRPPRLPALSTPRERAVAGASAPAPGTGGVLPDHVYPARRVQNPGLAPPAPRLRCTDAMQLADAEVVQPERPPAPGHPRRHLGAPYPL